MPEKSLKIFSLAEANELVPLVSEVTCDVVRRLDGIRQRHQIDSAEPSVTVPETVLKEVEEALRDWSDRVVGLGAYPKGYFTVDFQSADPELLYCWTYGEETIRFTHKVWENFSHRRPLEDIAEPLTDHLKWVN